MLLQCPDFIDIAALNKALGDVLRLQIVRVLAQDAYGVLELCRIFDYRQSAISHHLKVLAEANLVAKRREGNSIFYSRNLPLTGDSVGALSKEGLPEDGPVNNGPVNSGPVNSGEGQDRPFDHQGVSGSWVAAQQQLINTVDELELPVPVQHRVNAVKLERAERSRLFFEHYAEKFRERQDLIADYSIYGTIAAGLLARMRVPGDQLAVEIGPGEGEFLLVLAQRFAQVVALDNSPTLLDKAKTCCQRRFSQQLAQHHGEQPGPDNIDFVCADTTYLRGKPVADCVVMNMVLHHTPSPADIFQDIAQGMKPGGILLLTELSSHNQDWARSSCGDIWLGFDPKELFHWGKLAGLTVGHSHYFALRNGFQVQLQQFIKR